MNLIHYIYFTLLFLTIIHFISRYSQLEATSRLLIYFLLVMAIANSMMMFVRLQLQFRNNLFIAHIQTPLEYLALTMMFYRAIENSTTKRAVRMSAYGFVIVALCLSVFVETPDKNNSYAKILEALLVTIWVLLYFRQIFSSEKLLDLKQEPLFWINTGLLFYFIGTVFLQGSLNYLIENNIVAARKLYQFQYLFEFIFFLMVNVALVCRKIFKSEP